MLLVTNGKDRLPNRCPGAEMVPLSTDGDPI